MVDRRGNATSRAAPELAAVDWLVLHFSWRDFVERPQFVVAQVERTIETRKAAP